MALRLFLWLRLHQKGSLALSPGLGRIRNRLKHPTNDGHCTPALHVIGDYWYKLDWWNDEWPHATWGILSYEEMGYKDKTSKVACKSLGFHRLYHPAKLAKLHANGSTDVAALATWSMLSDPHGDTDLWGPRDHGSPKCFLCALERIPV